MLSLWQKTVELPEFEAEKREISTEVLIIGGGMAGILCAYALKQAGVDYLLLEGGSIGGGITKDTTAKITSHHGLIYSKLIYQFGVEGARLYLKANQTALKLFGAMSLEMDCDFEPQAAITYSLDNRAAIEEEMSALAKLGYRAEYTNKLPLPFPVAGAIRFANQAQFHPLKFLGGIVKGLNIRENTAVRELKGHTVTTDWGRVTADKIIVATHFPFINKHGSYFMKLYQHRSYVLALKNAPDVNGMYVDEAQKGLSFRNYKNLLLLGGGSHRTGKKGGGYSELEAFAKRFYPNAVERYRWATQDCMTLDSVPYIGRYSKNTPDFFVATGFNKWGMTSSMVSAMILSDLVRGKHNEFAELYSPSRSVLRPQLAVNAFESLVNFLTPTVKRCPHLGCALKWNKQERTWDCPCHGSRFDEEGKLIDNPATGDLKQT